MLHIARGVGVNHLYEWYYGFKICVYFSDALLPWTCRCLSGVAKTSCGKRIGPNPCEGFIKAWQKSIYILGYFDCLKGPSCDRF